MEFYEQNIPNFKNLKVKMDTLPNFGKSLVTTQTIAKNEIILAIPESLFLSVSSISNNGLIKQEILEKGLFSSFDKRSLLAFYLFLELNEKSKEYNGQKQFFWQNYFETIPSSYENIIVWDSEKDLKFLERRQLVDKFRNLIEGRALSDFTKLHKILQESQKIDFTFDRFRQLLALTESRTLFYKNELDPNSEVGALVPFYDYCNHTFFENDEEVDIYSSFFFDEKRKEFVLKATKNYEKIGEQVFISYGTYPNIHFLQYYGFFLKENPFEFLRFSFAKSEIAKVFGQNINTKIKAYGAVGKKLLPHLFFGEEQESQQQQVELPSFTLPAILDVDVEFDCKENTSRFVWQIQQIFEILSCCYLEKKEILNQNETEVVDKLSQNIQKMFPKNFKNLQNNNGKQSLNQNNSKNSKKPNKTKNNLCQQNSIQDEINYIALHFEDDDFKQQYIDQNCLKQYIENFKLYVLQNCYERPDQEPENLYQKLARNYADHEQNIIQVLQL